MEENEVTTEQPAEVVAPVDEVQPEQPVMEEAPITEQATEPAVETDTPNPADTVLNFIASNGISHVDAIRVDGLSQEDTERVIRDLKMSGKLQGDGSGRVWA